MLLTIVAFVVTLSLLVFVHELGHFLVAKRTGIEVEEFGFGYPPRLFTVGRRGGTEYTVNAIPFGGFVRLRGEDDPDVEGGFADAPKRARLATLLAGSGMNLLLALIAFTLAGWFASPVSQGVPIEKVLPDSPAAQAGLQAGDVVLAADGVALETTAALHNYIYDHLGQEVTFTVVRGVNTETPTQFTLQIVPDPGRPKDQGAIGVTLGRRLNAVQSLQYGVGMTASVIWLTLKLPALLLQGVISPADARPVGPVGIAQLTGGAVEYSLATGWWHPAFIIVGLISAALAITNLLPLPALDGGRITFIIVEAIRGKRVDPEKEALVHFIGLVVLVGLMVVITYQDIVSPIALPDWNQVF